jgi:hypothetical protein
MRKRPSRLSLISTDANRNRLFDFLGHRFCSLGYLQLFLRLQSDICLPGASPARGLGLFRHLGYKAARQMVGSALGRGFPHVAIMRLRRLPMPLTFGHALSNECQGSGDSNKNVDVSRFGRKGWA